MSQRKNQSSSGDFAVSDEFIDSILPDESEFTKVEPKDTPSDIPFNDEPSPWLWNQEEVRDEDRGTFKSFVYLMTNRITGKRYVGFKMLVSKKTRTVKGKKKRYEAESDWKQYWSSSDSFHSDVALYGRGNFIREIIAFCPKKGIGKYIELKEQIDREVITTNREKYYNGIINIRLSGRAMAGYEGVVYCSKPLLGDLLAKEKEVENVCVS